MFFNNNSYQNSPTLSNHIVSFITCLRGETLPKIKSNPLFYNPVTKQSKYSQNLHKKKSSNQNNLPVSPNYLNPNFKYTIFTCKTPCKSLIVSNKPLKGSSINKAFQNEKDLFEFHQTILNETSLLQFDKIYNETHNFDKIYNENIKDCIINLFKKKNTCVFFFGPKNSGKSYLLRGSNDMESNEKGLLSRSVDEIFNLIDLTKQVNKKEEKIKEHFLLKISFLEVFMDDVYDLLNPKKKEKNVKLEKYYENNQIKVDIVPIHKKLLTEKSEFEGYMKHVMTERKKLQKKLKIDSLNQKGHLIISLYIEKIEENKKNEENDENNEEYDNYYSQIDFVELASNDFGEVINYNNEFENNNNNLLAYNTNNVFNSIANNIICNSQNLTPKNESKVTLCLKNTLNYNSNCIFFNNVIPWEFPLKLSLKSLKFVNWIRNQIKQNVDMKLVDDRNNVMDNNNNIEDNYYNNENIDVENNKEKFKNLYYDNNESNYNNEGTNNNYDNDYNNDSNYDNLNNNNIPIANKSVNLNNFNNNENLGEKYINSSNVLYKNQNPNLNNNFNNPNNNSFNNNPNNNDQPKYINKINNYNLPNNAAYNSYDENDEKDLKIIRNRQFNNNNNNNLNNSNLNDNNINNNNTTYQSTQSLQNHFSPDDKNFKKLNKSLKDLQNKSFEINRNIKNLKSQSLQNNYSNNNPQFSINDEMATLKSDNIMFKEDINRLNNINKQLENNLNEEQNKYFEILNDNEKICKENCELKKIINELQNKKKEEETYEEKFNAKVILQNKLNETENELKKILDEKEKYEIEYKILFQKFNELQKDFSLTVNELNCLKHNHCNEMNKADNQINNMMNQLKTIENENFLLKNENEKLKILNCDLEKNVNALNFYLNEEKNKNEFLSKKIEEIEKDFKNILIQKENENYLKMKEEEMKKSKIETKAKIINDLQNQIQNYKNQRLIKKRERENNNSNDS